MLETMMHRFPSIRQTVSSNFVLYIFFNLHADTHNCNLTHVAWNYHSHLNVLFTYLFPIKCLYYFLSFFFILTYSCPYSYNCMLTTTYRCPQNKGYQQIMDTNKLNSGKSDEIIRYLIENKKK